MFGFLPHTFGFQRFCLSPFLRSLSPFPSPTLKVDSTLRLFFSSLVVFPHTIRFSRLPFGCSHILLFTHCFVGLSTLLFLTSLWFLAPSFVFNCLLFAFSAFLFTFSSCGFLSIPLCFSHPFGFAPFLVFVLTFLVHPFNCSYLLLHSFCFVAHFGFIHPPFRLPSLRHSGPHLPLSSRTP